MAMVMHIPPFPGMDAELQKQCCKYVLKVADKYPGFQLERREEFEEGTANLSNIDWAFRRITQAYNKMQIVTGTHTEKVKTFGSTLNMPCNDFMIPVPLLSMVAWARRNKYKWPLTADQVVLFEAAAEKDTLKETKETRKLKNKISALNKRKADLEAKLEAEHAAAELVELAGNKKARK